MSEGTIRAFLESKNGKIAVILFVLFIIYDLIKRLLDNRAAKDKESKLNDFFNEIRTSIQLIAESSKLKNRIIDGIHYKLKVIHSQYGGELNKEMASVIVHNVYLNFAHLISNEIYDLKKQNKDIAEIIKDIGYKIDIINDEKMEELNLFVYQKKILITFTNGKIIDTEKIIDNIKIYANKNGMLREQIQNMALIESSRVIKRL